MSPSVLIDTSVFCRAVQFKQYKNISLVELLDRIWRECFNFVMSPYLFKEYQECLVAEGVGSLMQLQEFTEALGDKIHWVDVTDAEVQEYLKKHIEFRSIDSDVPHLVAAVKARVDLMIFDDDGVEFRRNILKKILGVEVVNPIGFLETDEKERCTNVRIPFPFAGLPRR